MNQLKRFGTEVIVNSWAVFTALTVALEPKQGIGDGSVQGEAQIVDQLLEIVMQRLKTDPTAPPDGLNAEQSLLVGQAMAQKGNKTLLQHVAVTLLQQCNRLIQRHTTGRREGGMGEMEVGNRPIVGPRTVSRV